MKMGKKHFPNPYSKLFDSLDVTSYNLPNQSLANRVEKRRLLKQPSSIQSLANLDTDRIKPRMPIESESQDSSDSQFDLDVANVWKMKKRMLEKNLRHAKFKHENPNCAGKWHARLVPSSRAPGKKAIWIHCDGDCGFKFME